MKKNLGPSLIVLFIFLFMAACKIWCYSGSIYTVLATISVISPPLGIFYLFMFNLTGKKWS